MDENPKTDPLVARIEIINDAMGQIVGGIQAALTQDREPTTQECVAALHGVATLAASTVIAITEIADSVGKLVEISQRDFNAAVAAEAETVADVKQKETTKRSFIGQPKNND
jgi:hypothetical protein